MAELSNAGKVIFQGMTRVPYLKVSACRVFPSMRIESESLRLSEEVSFQLSTLKILAGQPDGRASVEVVKQHLALFYTVGPEWTERMKRLADRAPGLDIFSQKLVVREPGEWILTEAGRLFLETLERGGSVPEAARDDVMDRGAEQQTLLPAPSLPPTSTERRKRRDVRRGRERTNRCA
ncbi:hypothetical protein [Bradyrhizobium sp.]|uniref:hypothetical protein n=1 Tax=Bradyrhizobium sp. TaxID=376 RepID=UPI0039E27324